MKIAPLTPAEVTAISSPLMAELREVFLEIEGRAQSALSKAAREGLTGQERDEFGRLIAEDAALKQRRMPPSTVL